MNSLLRRSEANSSRKNGHNSAARAYSGPRFTPPNRPSDRRPKLARHYDPLLLCAPVSRPSSSRRREATLGWKLIEGGITSPESKIDIINFLSRQGFEVTKRTWGDYSFIDATTADGAKHSGVDRHRQWRHAVCSDGDRDAYSSHFGTVTEGISDHAV
jgi:hypothetical protein